LWYSHLHPPTPPPIQSIYIPTCPSTFLLTNILSRYLPNPTYMATPTYVVASPIDPNNWQRWKKNKMEFFHGTWSCSFKQINKGTIKVFDTPYINVFQVLFRECFPWEHCKPSG
jgi:hypothetical protein